MITFDTPPGIFILSFLSLIDLQTFKIRFIVFNYFLEGIDTFGLGARMEIN